MFKKVRGKIAGVLVMLLLGMTIFPGDVAAAEVTSSDQLENSADELASEGRDIIPEELDDENEGQQDVPPNESAAEAEGQGAVPQSEEENIQNEENSGDVLASSGLINYVGVEFPYLETPDEQKIVVSFGDGSENILDAKLTCQNEDGQILELVLSEKEKELYLFRSAFIDGDEGIYKLLNFSYTQDGIEKVIELAKIGIEAQFGVDEYYPGYGETTEAEPRISAEDIEMSVVEVDADKVEDVETDIEEAIEETAESVEEVTGKSGKKDTFLSSVADVIMPATVAEAAEDVVVVLDPGHGGSDGGANGHGLYEKNLTLSIAKYCKEELEQYNGVTVYMTRESDVYVGLEERVQKAKNWGAKVFVSIHINSAAASANGAEVWYPNPNYNAEINKQGEQLADEILQQLVQLGLADRGIKVRYSDNEPGNTYPDGSRTDYYSVIRNSKRNGFPGIIVEHAFISNSSDAAKLAQESFQKQLGIADATGIANYFNLTKGASVKIEKKNDFDGVAQIKAAGLGKNAKIRVTNTDVNKYKEYNVLSGKGTIDFNIKDIGNARGNFSVKAYNSSGHLLCEKTFYISKDTSSEVTIESDGTEKVYKVNVKFKDMPSEIKEVKIPVWCANDQSDIIWHTARQTASGNWQATINVGDYRKAGVYNVHVYAYIDGVPRGIGATNFKVSSPNMKTAIQNYNADKGTFEVVISNIESKSGVSKVQVPVWCADNQSDIKWYDAVKQKDGSYKATVSMANHNYATGTYKVHVYLTTGNGILKGVIAGEQKMSLVDMQISAEDVTNKEMSYALKVSNVNLTGIRGVQFAVWSDKNGQDDLIWYAGSKNTLGEWTATADIRKHRTVGRYNVHVYATLANGTLKGLGVTTFDVSNPSMNAVIQNYKAESGTFEVVINGINSKSGVASVQVPAWCAADQSDIKWYDAARQNDGSYKATISMANHNYAMGSYKVHVYLTTGNGIFKGIVAGEQKVVMPNMQISAEDLTGTQMKYALKVSNVDLVRGIAGVQFAVWSDKNGQDDLIWYAGSKNALGEWTATAEIGKHRTEGRYNVHVYATLTNGTLRGLGVTTFDVSNPAMRAAIQNYEAQKGTFDVVINGIESKSGVSKVQVPVWCATNQSDIKWYDAAKQKDGSYKVTVSMANHNYATGNYQVHVYLTTGNGILKGIVAGEQKVTIPNIQISAEDVTGMQTKYALKVSKVSLIGVIRGVQFAVWSDKNGQDDLIWYPGTKNALGEWTATAEIARHKTEGRYNVHVYATLANGTLKGLGMTSFEVDPYSIMGDTTATAVQMKKYYESSGKQYPSSQLSIGGAPTLESFCQIFIEEAQDEGVRAEVAFVQAMKETGWLQYGGIVKIEQFNFAGIGALDGNASGDCASFPDVRTGIRAQIQHLKAYGSSEALRHDQVDPRFDLVKRGCAPYVEWLGKQENPDGYGWATSKEYGYQIVSMIKSLKSM